MDAIEWEQQRAWVEINLSALAHNVRQIRNLLAPTTSIMAVVKADAYGHGAIDVARTIAAGVEWLAVATVPEGIELRQAGIVAPILILGVVNQPLQVQAIAFWRLDVTVCSQEQALWLSKFAATLGLTASLPVHLKLDTGMSRLGENWHQGADFYAQVKSLPYLKIASLYSHLATADELDRTELDLQAERFRQTIDRISKIEAELPPLHLANSAGILVSQSLHYQMVRPGLILHGIYPAPHFRADIDLKPVLSVKAKIDQIKAIAPGTGVSYGYRFIADRHLRIATVGIGYADGIPRRLSGQMQVGIRGRLVPQIGSITMDRIILDISQFDDLQVGDIVTILGEDGEVQITADDWANRLGTISWEILCGFKDRLPRIAFGYN